MDKIMCGFCKMPIPEGATKCHHCLAELNGEGKSNVMIISRNDLFFFKALGLIVAFFVGLLGLKASGLVIDMGKLVNETEMKAITVDQKLVGLERELDKRIKEVKHLKAINESYNVVADLLFSSVIIHAKELRENIVDIETNYSKEWNNINTIIRLKDDFVRNNRIVASFLYFLPNQGLSYRFVQLDPSYDYQYTLGLVSEKTQAYLAVKVERDIPGRDEYLYRKIDIVIRKEELERIKG